MEKLVGSWFLLLVRRCESLLSFIFLLTCVSKEVDPACTLARSCLRGCRCDNSISGVECIVNLYVNQTKESMEVVRFSVMKMILKALN